MNYNNLLLLLIPLFSFIACGREEPAEMLSQFPRVFHYTELEIGNASFFQLSVDNELTSIPTTVDLEQMDTELGLFTAIAVGPDTVLQIQLEFLNENEVYSLYNDLHFGEVSIDTLNWEQRADTINILLEEEIISQFVTNAEFTELRMCVAGTAFNYYDDFLERRVFGGYALDSHQGERNPERHLNNFIDNEVGDFTRAGDTLYVNFSNMLLTQQ